MTLALSYVNNESPLEESYFGTPAEGRSLDPHSLSNIRRNNINHLNLPHIGINCIRNKYDMLRMALKEKLVL